MKRVFLVQPPVLIIASICLTLLPAPRGLVAAPGDNPNVLLILTDDHAAYALGCYGSEIARTPHLDRLASEGALFSRAYCNSPMCTPSRQSLITGKMPHAAGVTLLRTALADHELTLGEFLGASNYATGAIGKMHFNSQLRHGFQHLLGRGQFGRALRARGGRKPLPAAVETLGPWRPFRDHARAWLNGGYLPFPAREVDMDATYYAEAAIAYLNKKHDRPFFLIVSFTQPHSPFNFPVEFRERYEPEKIPLPAVGPEDAPQIPLIFRDLSRVEKQRINASYYTAVEFVDKKVGEVLAALDRRGLAENTLVLYAGDHGYTLGHHGRFEKHCFYEEAVHSPLIARWPGKIAPKRKIAALVEFVDIFPTVVEVCGLEPPPGLHGKSLLPLLTGKPGANPHRESIVSLYFINEEAMIRTDRWKLIYCTGRRAREDGYKTDHPTPGRYRKLFDLEKDPGEMQNLAADPPQRDRIRRLEAALLERIAATRAPDLTAPDKLTREEKLDWYLVPPEVRRMQRAVSAPPSKRGE